VVRMPRPKIRRRIYFIPNFGGFGPRGVDTRTFVELTLDEIEAIRLKDFEGMTQEEAAKKMNVSQPTFNRLLQSARKKIAEALVEGKNITFSGGDVLPPRGRGSTRYCVCPVCGHVQLKQSGVPCSSIKCEKCGSRMIRG